MPNPFLMRTGGRSNESNNSYGLNGDDHLAPALTQYTRELPQDLSKEELIKEAEKVIAQTESVKCTIDTPNSLAGIRLQEKLLEGNTNPVRKTTALQCNALFCSFNLCSVLLNLILLVREPHKLILY